MQTLISWNVNGIRAVAKKGLIDWLEEANPDVFSVQETKAHPDQLDDDLLKPLGYTSHFVSAEKKGYSGVATYFKTAPDDIETMGVKEFDAEGRVQILHFPGYSLINAYFPNSQHEGKRLDYKIRFCNDMLKLCKRLEKKGRHVIICGDYNIAHEEIDLARPKANTKNPGFLPEEREWMTTFLSAGYTDCFRDACPDPDHYTWWSYRANARAKNVGWRIDYHCVNDAFMPQVASSRILPDVTGSDHCPVELTLDV